MNDRADKIEVVRGLGEGQGLPPLWDYQDWVRGRIKGNTLEHLVFGLVEEAGEAAGKMKRLTRGDYKRCHGQVYEDGVQCVTCGHVVNEWSRFQEALGGEAGDVLFYLVALIDRQGIDLGQLAAANRRKIEDRIARGVYKGEGDTR